TDDERGSSALRHRRHTVPPPLSGGPRDRCTLLPRSGHPSQRVLAPCAARAHRLLSSGHCPEAVCRISFAPPDRRRRRLGAVRVPHRESRRAPHFLGSPSAIPLPVFA